LIKLGKELTGSEKCQVFALCWAELVQRPALMATVNSSLLIPSIGVSLGVSGVRTLMMLSLVSISKHALIVSAVAVIRIAGCGMTCVFILEVFLFVFTANRICTDVILSLSGWAAEHALEVA